MQSDMLTRQEVDWVQDNELQVLAGRRCQPGEFYFVKRTLSSINAITLEKVYAYANEYVEPVIRLMKGDEHLVIPAGILKQGDIMATLDWRKSELSTDEPTTVSGTQYQKAVYKDEEYQIAYLHKDGLGSDVVSRWLILLRKESD